VPALHQTTNRKRSSVTHKSDALPRTTVRFSKDEGGRSVLEVETSERGGFVHGLSRALLDHSVQILRAEVRRVGAGARDRFVLAEADGSPLSAARMLALQVAVLAVVDLGVI